MKIPKPKKLASGKYRIQLRLNGKSVCVYGLTPAECKRNAMLAKLSKEEQQANLTVEPCLLPQVVRNEHSFLDPEPIKPFLEAIHGEDCELMALFALHGLRRSEILYLRPEHIKNGKILVRGSSVIGPDGWVDKVETKTGKSRRDVPILIPRIYDLIEGRKGRLVTEQPVTMRKHIDAICREHDLPEVGIHGLRHTFASLCYSLGISEAVCMELGGWSDITIMRKIYTHLAQKDKRGAEQKLREFFFVAK